MTPLSAAASGVRATPAAQSPGHSAVSVFSAAYGVSCPRVSYCIAVGAYNANDVVRVLTELWNGPSWSVVPSPVPHGAAASQLNAVSCSSASQCVAVGSYTDTSGTNWPFAEVWDGAAWSLVPVPVPNGASGVALNGISCAGASSCVAVGGYTNRQFVPRPLTESWNGSSWSIVAGPAPAGSGSGLSAVSCSSASMCMATGFALNAEFEQVPLAELWNGSSWSVVASPQPHGAQGGSLDAVSCPSATRCRAVGEYSDADFVSETLAESWNGSRWSVVASPTPSRSPNSDLYGISCAAASQCLAVGHSYSPTSAAKDANLVESWDGSSWSVVPSPSPSTTSALTGVSCAAVQNCRAVGLFFNASGDYQTLAESWNGSSMSIANQDAELTGVSCVDESHCVAVGNYIAGGSISQTLIESWDGHSWSLAGHPDPSGSAGSYLNGISCLSADWCTAVGYYYRLDNTRVTLTESWNGVRWSIVPSPNARGAAYSVLEAVSCASASECLAVGSAAGRVLAEKWDGAHWTIVATPDPSTTAYAELAGITCTSATRCLAVGYETDTYYHADLTLAEQWNGSAWSIVQSAAPGKNAALTSVLHGLSCSTVDECLAVGVHQRSDGTFATFTEHWTGTGWAVLGSPSPSGSVYSELNAISCVDDGRCLAVGNYFNRAGKFVTLSETWTGGSWRIAASSTTATLPAGISYLLDVSCAASFTCLAVGTHGNPANLDRISQLWDGSAWQLTING